MEYAQPSSMHITDKNFYTVKSNQMVKNEKSDLKNLTEFHKKYEKYLKT